jgi:MoxR-like ATPase
MSKGGNNMVKELNLHLYEGNGVGISERNQVLPDYETMKNFDHPKYYIAGDGLRNAVNVALALGQPLLVTGEPGTGKTQLAASIAHELDLPLLKFYTKTTSTAVDLFYQYDALRRFQDVQMKKEENYPEIDINDYITYQALGMAILITFPPEEVKKFLPKKLQDRGPTRSVVLIDEIDKAPRDLPNDVLNEIEKMEFTVKETGKTFEAEERFRPILVLTSNSEKNLPEAFLRRCIFYHIPFPSKEHLRSIVQKRFMDRVGFTQSFIDAVVNHFFEIRNLPLKKRPATAEFLDWVNLLYSLGLNEKDIKDIEKIKYEQAEVLALSFSILAKTNEDFSLLEKKFSSKNKGDVIT